MDTHAVVITLAEAGTADRAAVGGKAGVLGELIAAGLPVPPGLVVTAAALDVDGWEISLVEIARGLGVERFAVRSSGAAEDLPDASYAGLYETYLNVTAQGLGEAVQRRIDRTGGQVQRAVAAGAQSFDDGVPVLRAGFEDREQQRVEVAFEQFRAHRQHSRRLLEILSVQLSTLV